MFVEKRECDLSCHKSGVVFGRRRLPNLASCISNMTASCASHAIGESAGPGSNSAGVPALDLTCRSIITQPRATAANSSSLSVIRLQSRVMIRGRTTDHCRFFSSGFLPAGVFS